MATSVLCMRQVNSDDDDDDDLSMIMVVALMAVAQIYSTAISMSIFHPQNYSTIYITNKI